MTVTDIGVDTGATRGSPGQGAGARVRKTFAEAKARVQGAIPRMPDRAPSVTLPMPGGKSATFVTDRVRARPALSSTLSGTLGLNAIALGVLGTFFPRRVSNFLGVNASRGAVVSLFGLRELVSGYALVSDPTRTGALWSRVLFDVFDIAVLKAAADDPFNKKRGNARGALCVVLTVSALDLIAAVRQSTVKRNCE